MTTIRQKLDQLSPEQRGQLNYAFEIGVANYVELSDGTFIGVNVGKVQHLEIKDTAGNWSSGHIKYKGLK